MADFQFRWPNVLTANTSSGSNATLTTYSANGISANNNEIVYVCRAEEACTITSVGWVQSSFAGSPGTLRVGIMGVNNTGAEDGTYLGGGNAYADKSTWSSGDNGKYIFSTLGSNVTLARGDLYAIKINPQSGTWNTTTDNVSIGYFLDNMSTSIATPYPIVNNVRPTSQFRLPNIFVRTATRAYLYPYESFFEWDIATTSSPQQVGARFIVPASVCDTFTVNGVALYLDAIGGSVFDIALYQGTNRTALQRVTVDSDQLNTGGVGSINGAQMIYFDEVTLSALSAGTEYRIMIESGSTVPAGRFRATVVPTASDMTAYIGTSSTWEWTEWSGSAYSETSTRQPLMQLLINDVTEPTSGSGILVHPGMTGGMRG